MARLGIKKIIRRIQTKISYLFLYELNRKHHYINNLLYLQNHQERVASVPPRSTDHWRHGIWSEPSLGASCSECVAELADRRRSSGPWTESPCFGLPQSDTPTEDRTRCQSHPKLCCPRTKWYRCLVPPAPCLVVLNRHLFPPPWFYFRRVLVINGIGSPDHAFTALVIYKQ